MDTRRYKYNKIKNEQIPTIVVASPSCETLNERTDNHPTMKKVSINDDSNQSESEDEEVWKLMEKRRESMGRRNSISLPNLEDLKAVPDKVSVSKTSE